MIGILKNLNFIDKEIFAAQRQMFMAHRERKAEYKPLSFSTTMRNPARIADFLQCILPYQGQILTNRIILAVAAALIKKKLYQPLYINRTPRLKAVLNEERDFSDEEAAEIMRTVHKIIKKPVLIKVGLPDLIHGTSFQWSLDLFTMKWIHP